MPETVEHDPFADLEGRESPMAAAEMVELCRAFGFEPRRSLAPYGWVQLVRVPKGDPSAAWLLALLRVEGANCFAYRAAAELEAYQVNLEAGHEDDPEWRQAIWEAAAPLREVETWISEEIQRALGERPATLVVLT